MPQPEKETRVSVGQFATNALYTIASQWVIRLIGLVSVVILARLLAPEDFGLIGVALSAVIIAEIFTEIGIKAALVSHPDPTTDDYNTAWTTGVIINLAMCLATILLVAPMAEIFYQRDDIALVIQVLSLRFVFNGIRNVGIIELERNLNFKRDFYLRSYARILSFVITIASAYYLQNYWALVIGAIGMSMCWTIFSYTMHSFRPRICFTYWRYYLQFSSWMLMNAVSQGVTNQIERIMLGRVTSDFVVGLYSTSQDLARIFTWEIVIAIGRVALPSLVRVRDDKEEFSYHMATAFGGYSIVAIPFALGLSATAEQVVPVLLGTQWLEAVPYLHILAIAAGLRAIATPMGPILLAANKAHLLAITNTVFAVAVIALVITVALLAAPIDIARSVALANILMLLAAILIIARTFDAKVFAILFAIGRPALAGAGMYAVVAWLELPEGLPAAILLLLLVAAGAISYGLFLLVIWYLFGKPEGAEAKVIRQLRVRLNL